MFGFFGLFGRSHELRQLDAAVRAAGLHPRLMSDAVKLTTLRLLKEARGGGALPPDAYEGAAQLLVYCMLGTQAFEDANGVAPTRAVEARLA
jgi:hypothetical protein